jgi:hypothetical protein
MNSSGVSMSNLIKKSPKIKSGFSWNFRFIFAFIPLMLLAYLCGNLSELGLWSQGYYFIAVFLGALYFIVLGISTKTALFATVALLPGFHYLIPIFGFYLSSPEIFAVVFILLRLKSPIFIRKIPIIMLFCGLYFSCFLSLIGSSYILSSMGLLIRFGLVIGFCILCLSERRSNELSEIFLKGFMITPLSAVAFYWGDGALYDSVILGVINLERAVYSSFYPIWFSFFIPLAIYLKINRVSIVVVILLSILLITTSFSRSLIIGSAIVMILYLLFFRLKGLGNKFLKIILLLGLFVCGYIVIIVLNLMTFSAEDGSFGAASSEVRYSLVKDAITLFLKKPIFGSGFGAESLITNENVISETSRPSVQVSFIQSLVELGVFGTFFYVGLFYHSFISLVKVINNQAILAEIRVCGLIAFATIVTLSIANTAMIRLDMYIFLIYPILLHKSYTKEFRKFL